MLAMSVMDANYEYVRELIGLAPDRQWVLGGYVDYEHQETLRKLGNVLWFDDMTSMADHLIGSPVAQEPCADWSVFSGWPAGVIRIQQSTGCIYNCRMCTVSRQTKEIASPHIRQQIGSVRKYMGSDRSPAYMTYLDDKTFGISPAHEFRTFQEHSAPLREDERWKGWIVQTSPAQVTSPEWCDMLARSDVKVVELGIESMDPRALNLLGKPFVPDTAANALDYFRASQYSPSLRVVPNVVFGMPNQDFDRLFYVLEPLIASKVVPWVNTSWLAVYPEGKAKLGPLLPRYKGTVQDRSEMSPYKSWLDEGERQRQVEAMSHLYSLFGLT